MSVPHVSPSYDAMTRAEREAFAYRASSARRAFDPLNDTSLVGVTDLDAARGLVQREIARYEHAAPYKGADALNRARARFTLLTHEVQRRNRLDGIYPVE